LSLIPSSCVKVDPGWSIVVKTPLMSVKPCVAPGGNFAAVVDRRDGRALANQQAFIEAQWLAPSVKAPV
jgi:hypothetical protein